MTKALDLTASDLEITEEVFCQLMDKQNCLKSYETEKILGVKKPLRNVSATTRISSRTKTSSTTVTPILLETNDDLFQNFEKSLENDFEISEIETFPEKITCDGIIAAGPASSSFSVEDLKSWTSKEILYCIDVLGKIDWTNEKKIDIWNYAIFKVVNFESCYEVNTIANKVN